MRGIDSLALLLVIIGGINWGLIGVFDYNLAAAIFGGPESAVTRILYIVVGAAALWTIRMLSMVCRPHGPYLPDRPHVTERTPTPPGSA